MSEYLLEMNNITKYIFSSNGQKIKGTDVKILDDVTLKLKKGEVLALLGENGAGKSTLMKVLGGVIPQDEGTMILDGEEVRFGNPRESMAKGIAFIHQELNLCTNIDVARNFFLTEEPVNRLGLMKKGEMNKRAKAALAELGIDINPNKRLSELSTAEQQVVEIAKAISQDVKILIMDEPTSSLTKKEIDMLFDLIFKLKAKGISIIYISHRLDEIRVVGDSMTVLRDGRNAGELDRSTYTEDKIVQLMAGLTLGQVFHKDHVPLDKVMLEVKGLQLGPRSKPFDFYVRAGEVVGFCGLVGAGRTETIRAIYGEYNAIAGKVVYDGKEYANRTSYDSIKKGMIYLSEDRKIDGLVTAAAIRENISVSALAKLFPNGLIKKKKEKTFAEEMIEKFNVKCLGPEMLVNSLSGGNQQKVSFAKCYAVEPKLLLLDEPTRGIDVGAKSEIYRIINEAAKNGLAVVVVSSEMAELIGLSDRIYVMHEGTVTKEVTKAEEMNQEYLVGQIIGVGQTA